VRRVVITGLGAIAPNANGKDAFGAALKAGVSGIRAIPRLAELNFGCQVGGVPQDVAPLAQAAFRADELMAMSDAMVYAGLAALEAVRDAGLTVPAWDEDKLDEDMGAIVGTGVGGLSTFAEKVYPGLMAGQVRRLGSSTVEQVMASSVSAKLSGLLALGNQVTTNSSACSTGTEALIMGADRIRVGKAKRMVVGGAEGASEYSWAGFDAMRVLCRKFNDQPARASRPLSASAGGFVPGSGAGILVLEDLESAKARGARIYAEVLGSALNSGGMRKGGSMTAPSGYSVQRCVRSALLDADLAPETLDYVNGHLTATMADPLEMANWAAALEAKPERFPLVNSTKSMIGHALGAAGALECVATVLQLAGDFVHGSLNCEDLHPGVAAFGARIVHESRSASLTYAAKASFGFGDVNSCVIFKKWKESHV
jgi:3-oxoacyl-(acyl-carrier-protein) synthase